MGDVRIIAFWVSTCGALKCTEKALRDASQYNHMDILGWWKQNVALNDWKYDDSAVDRASEAGHIDVLNWWLTCGQEVRYSERAMDRAASRDVLDWWVSSGLELMWSRQVLTKASRTGNISILEWWKESGLLARCGEEIETSQALSLASQNGHLCCLEWFLRSGFSLRATEQCIALASIQGHVEILKFWMDSSLLEWKFSPSFNEMIHSESPESVTIWWSEQLRLRKSIEICDS